ncbi:nucleoside-diphosphate-sugar epimerase [Pedobacter sp. CAN_A7]|uniref:NAD-dependent epimerase/dehydratase family protein n=1 Tax=Pedobacter sp. CAN_A7 TaxID=2787722 RepID=UPI0018CA9EC2
MILLTGAHGFLGGYIYKELIKIDATDTLSRNKGTYQTDLSDEVPVLNKHYDLVIHCAGKAHSVPKTDKEKEEFFRVNVNGTRNLLSALSENPSLPASLVLISTVAVYGLDTGKNIKENAALKASDPYGKSKIQAEGLATEWCLANKVKLSILRLPLIIGDEAPGNLAAMINGIRKGFYVNIGGGKACKSMVLAQDVANVIPRLAAIGGIYNLTDGYHPSFIELSTCIAKQIGARKPGNIPFFVAKALAHLGDLLGAAAPININKLRKITTDLTFDDTKARKEINWHPTPVLKGFKIKKYAN